jgi:hypothetical protein
MDLEGMPPHVWREDIAAKLLAPYCWIQSVEPITAAGDDLSAFRLTAWAKCPSALPKIIWLNVAEHEVNQPAVGGFRFRGTQRFLWKKDALRYKIIVHLRTVHDYSPYKDGDSSSDDTAEAGQSRKRHHGDRGSATEVHPFPCHRGVPDGSAQGSSTGGQHRQRGQPAPQMRVPAHQRLGPHGKARVPPQRIGSYTRTRVAVVKKAKRSIRHRDAYGVQNRLRDKKLQQPSR